MKPLLFIGEVVALATFMQNMKVKNPKMNYSLKQFILS